MTHNESIDDDDTTVIENFKPEDKNNEGDNENDQDKSDTTESED